MERGPAQLHEDLHRTFQRLLDQTARGTRDQMERLFRLGQVTSSRRDFLRGGLVTAGAIGGGTLLAACGASGSSSATTSAPASADLRLARLAASLEVLAVQTYDAALMAASNGTLKNVPSALAQFAKTAKAQHGDHLQAWNATLTAAGESAQTAPNPRLDPMVKASLRNVQNFGDVLTLALQLETGAVETYTKGAGLFTDKMARQTALTIAPVEAQHVAILHFVMGTYPVPDTFVATDKARGTDDLAG